ncbi:28S ribosomal protein S22, mitochondrial [Orussus abietinus]|uniref:28S ribosomal protein S22, mitochondrial n=1 Tax=Orussus abietinus TaxID=222816 RepID=UPI0006269650|nr:28S ribosomal protein S22, mitochondrial [Orussus abietinus]
MASTGTQFMIFLGKNVLSRNSHTVLRYPRYNLTTKYREYNISTSESHTEADPAPLFFNEKVQILLKELTGINHEKVYRNRKLGDRLTTPNVKFMTNDELAEARAYAESRGARSLQMPPVVKQRKEINKILCKDVALQGHDTAKYVFTDITFGIKNSDRLIVIRETDGTLRYAKWDERSRVNQVYFPIKGKEFRMPKMFQQEHLEPVLLRKDYEFILDRACMQLDPDDPEYHKITTIVYDRISNEKDYDLLRSTRHYGPLIFYLVWNKKISELLLENITTERIQDAVKLIQLYHVIHPNEETAKLKYAGNDLKYLEEYTKLVSSNQGKLVAAINTFKEVQNQRQKILQEVRKNQVENKV